MRKKNYVYESEEVSGVEIMSLFDDDKANGMFDNIDNRIVMLSIENFAFREGMIRYICDKENMIIYGARDYVARLLEDDVWISIDNGKAIGHMGGFVSCEYRIAFIIGYFCREVGLKFDIYPIYSVHKKLKEKLDKLGREMGGIELPDTLNQDSEIFDGEIQTYFCDCLGHSYKKRLFNLFDQYLNRALYFNSFVRGYHIMRAMYNGDDSEYYVPKLFSIINTYSKLNGNVAVELSYMCKSDDMFGSFGVEAIARVYYKDNWIRSFYIPYELIDDVVKINPRGLDKDVGIDIDEFYQRHEVTEGSSLQGLN